MPGLPSYDGFRHRQRLVCAHSCPFNGPLERLPLLRGEPFAVLRYSPGLGWLAWDGRRWKPDTDGEAIRRAKRTVRAMYARGAEIDDEPARKRLIAWAASSESEARLAPR